MTLTQRERLIAFGLAGALALVGLYQFALEPFLDRGKTIADERGKVDKELDDADLLMTKQIRGRLVWNKLKASGALKSDAFDARSQLIHEIESWAQESGVNLTALNSEHASQGAPADPRQDKPETKFEKISVHATGFGPMSAIAKLMWKVESAPMLLRVTEIQLTPHKEEAVDSLQLQLGVSTVSQAPEAEKAPGAGSVASAQGGQQR